MPSRQSTPDLWDEMRQQNSDLLIYEQAVAYAFEYLESIGKRAVFPLVDELQGLARFEEDLPDEPGDVLSMLRLLHEAGSPATVAQGGGRYFGFVNGGVIPGSLAARWLADAWDQNAALHVISPIASRLERLCEEWLVDLLALPPGTAAGFVSGTSIATMCGLLAGRNSLLEGLGWDANEQGLFGAPPIRVIMSEQAHGTVRKALAIIGIGGQAIEVVAADEQGRLDPDHLPALDERSLLILQAGNVNSGAFDPFVAPCAEARRAGAWVHVDGAFGLWAAACRQTERLTQGSELANSWSVDAHKTLNAPYDSGIILCRDRAALVNAMQASGSYMQFSEERDGMLYTPEMSRRARSIELWALLKTLGRRGVDELVRRLCDNASLFAGELRKHGFRILNDVVFNQVLVACEAPEYTVKTLENMQASGECWCGGSEWRGEPVIRISVCSWSTTAEDVHRSVQAFIVARDLARQQEEA